MEWKDYSREKARFVFHTPGERERRDGLWAVRGGQTITKQGYSAGPKRMDGYSIHMVQEGSVLLEIGDRTVTLQGGDLFCMFRGYTYSYCRPDGCARLLMGWLVFDGPDTEELLKEGGLTPEQPYRLGRLDAPLQSAFEQLLERMETPGSGRLSHSLAMQSDVLRFFSILTKDGKERGQAASLGWVGRSLRYADQHAAEGLSVEQLAAIAGMNRSYFSSAFAQQTGTSPSQYLMRVRMEKAVQMLQQSTASITEIAYSLGYANPYVFTRAFTRRYKMPPTAYRESYVKGTPSR